jgi:hypothetical protein
MIRLEKWLNLRRGREPQLAVMGTPGSFNATLGLALHMPIDTVEPGCADYFHRTRDNLHNTVGTI